MLRFSCYAATEAARGTLIGQQLAEVSHRRLPECP
jgi:hypothetical protein